MLTIKRTILNQNLFKYSKNINLCFYGSSSSSNSNNSSNGISSSVLNEDEDDKNESLIFLKKNNKIKKFKLKKSFIDSFSLKKAPFDVLGELVYKRTYSRVKSDGISNEEWFETIERVVNGTYNMQRKWIEDHGLEWNEKKAQSSAQEMYKRIFEMKFLPAGRGLWGMGSPITESKGLYAALNNCAFVSTEKLNENPTKPFIFLMDASMLGIGVGFDTKGNGSFIIKGPKEETSNIGSNNNQFIVPDSREGWVKSVQLLLDSYFLNKIKPTFDYSEIRKKGDPIKGFGGTASGYEPLKQLHDDLISRVLDPSIGKPISVTNIVDIMNLIGRCVVAGNRQTAEIAFGDPYSQEYIDLKNYQINPHRAEFGWTSNNSVFAELGMDYSNICKSVIRNGEPGFAWLDNMKNYSRMIPTELDHKDSRAMGGNPCLEQTLESYELCCLVETFPNNHDSLEDYLKTLKYAFLYAKTVTLGSTQWPDTNRVLLRNRRIGCSMSGLSQFIQYRGLHQLQQWCTAGYNLLNQLDNRYSEWLAIPKSIKRTSIKPSGTVSLLAGATPGMHYPISEFYIRRIRIPNESDLLPPLIEAGYHIEPALDSNSKMVVEIPIHSGKGIRSADSISMWEQLSLASFLQKYWADNQVSCTVSFNPTTEGSQLTHALDYFQYQLKGISFLPNQSLSSSATQQIYKQLPYEKIDENQYNQIISKIKPIDFQKFKKQSSPSEPTPDKFCDSNTCSIISNNSETL